MQGGEGRWRITNAAFSRARHDKVTEDVQTSRDGQESGDAVRYSLNFHLISLRRSEGHSKTTECSITMYQTQTINSQTLSTDIACEIRK